MIYRCARQASAFTLKRNISEKDGFEVTLESSAMTVLNNTGADAFKVLVVVYKTEAG